MRTFEKKAFSVTQTHLDTDAVSVPPMDDLFAACKRTLSDAAGKALFLSLGELSEKDELEALYLLVLHPQLPSDRDGWLHAH